MHDINQLLQQLGGGADPSLQPRLRALLEGAQGAPLAAQLRALSGDELRQAVQRGDAAEIRQAVGQLLQTPEGAQLAARLRQALGK